MTGHDTEHKGIIMTITEDADMDPKPYILTAISIGLEGAATGMALAGGHWLLSLLFLLLTVLFAINGWRAVGRARMRKTECREFVVDGCHNIIIAGDDRHQPRKDKGMTNHEVWDKTIELNGVAIQSVVCMEECSELIKAISKRLRGELDIENNLAEEMADVTICLYQLARMYDVDDTDVHAWIDRKTERQRKRNALQDHQSGETTR